MPLSEEPFPLHLSPSSPVFWTRLIPLSILTCLFRENHPILLTSSPSKLLNVLDTLVHVHVSGESSPQFCPPPHYPSLMDSFDTVSRASIRRIISRACSPIPRTTILHTPHSLLFSFDSLALLHLSVVRSSDTPWYGVTLVHHLPFIPTLVY